MRMVIVEGGGAVLGVNLGHPIVTNGDMALPKLLWAVLICLYSWGLLLM